MPAAESSEMRGGISNIGTLTVLVRDTGTGLSDKLKQTLLQTVQPSSGVEVGCGLGLVLVEKLLVSMGTTLEFRSPWTAEHTGTEFTFSLEVREGVPPPTASAPKQSIGTTLSLPHELRVLIADDLASNRKLLLCTLKRIIRSPIKCVQVSTAQAAVKAAKERHFDLIFMDEVFADEGSLRGSGAMREIREAEDAKKSGRSAIVSCTGFAGFTTESGTGEDLASKPFFDAGSDAVWGKPIPSHIDGSMQREIVRILAFAKAPMAQ